MGFKVRRSVKVFPGVRMNRNGKSTSVTVGGKYHRRTISSTGRVTETTRIPGTHVSFTTTSHVSERKKEASPTTNKVCGIILLALGALAAFAGLISFPVGGWLLMLCGVPLLIFGKRLVDRAKQSKKPKQ